MGCLARKWTIPPLHHPRLRWAKRGGFAGKNGGIARHKEGRSHGNRERNEQPTPEAVGGGAFKVGDSKEKTRPLTRGLAGAIQPPRWAWRSARQNSEAWQNGKAWRTASEEEQRGAAEGRGKAELQSKTTRQGRTARRRMVHFVG